MAYKARLAVPDSFYEFPFPDGAKPGEAARFRFRVLSLRERLALAAPADQSGNGDPTKRVVDAFELLRKAMVGWDDLEDEKTGPVKFDAGGPEILPMDIANWALGKALEINYGITAPVAAASEVAAPAVNP